MGERHDGCPWRVFTDPDIAEVLRTYDWFESGQCAERWGPDPEWWLVEAAGYFHRAIGRARADAIKIEHEHRKPRAPSLPAGMAVVDTIRG